MTSATFSTSLEAQQAAALMEGYRFELGNHDARQWVSLWLEFYRPSWIRDAVVEALYQGRYKSVSVRQILELWNRRGQPIRHVTYEFEAAVCREFGEIKVAPMPPAVPVQHRSIRIQEVRSPAADLSPIAAADDSVHGGHNGGYNGGQTTANGHRKPVSFDLATLPPTPPGIAAALSAQMAAEPTSGSTSGPTSGPTFGPEDALPKVSNKKLDHKAWREFSTYTTSTHVDAAIMSDTIASDADAVLHAQRQFNGVLYASARAIQPFKPALPFSAKTLRLAKQKAMA